MDNQYDAYCMADPHFYDTPTVIRRAELDFAVTARAVPDGWRRNEQDDWLVYRPEDVTLPGQGWKVHVAACLDNADEVLGIVWDYAVSRRLAFKYLRGRHIMLKCNAKYAHRGSSGKLVTLYPTDEAQLELVLKELGDLLDGQPGPYILSDLRWGDGPLHVRYGAFTEPRHVVERGVLRPAIVDDAGRLVADLVASVAAWHPASRS